MIMDDRCNRRMKKTGRIEREGCSLSIWFRNGTEAFRVEA